MKKYLLLLLILINGNAFISEVFYDPPGSDNNKEFVEIFHNQEINLTNFTIQDLSSEDLLVQVKYFPSNYSLIVEEGFNHTNINATIYSAGKTIGNNLNNNRDIIIIRNKTEILDVFSYFDTSNGKSLCIPYNFCSPTPGYENNEMLLEENFTLLINEIMPNPYLGNEWIELYNYGPLPIDITNLIIKDSKNNKISINSLTTNKTLIYDYSVIYLPRNILNNDKDVIYLLNESIIDKVSYSNPEKDVSFSRFKSSFKKTKPSPGQENNEEVSKLKEKLKIKSILLGSDKKANFGDNVIINFDVSRQGNKDNYISLYVENLTKKLKIKVPNKFTNYSFSLPVQLDPNCNNKLKSAYYDVVLEGFDKKTTKSIKVSGNSTLCKFEKIYVERERASVTTSNKDLKLNTKTDKIVFIDRNKDIFRNIIYIFCGLLLILLFFKKI